MASVLDIIRHYQQVIEKHSDDEARILRCIDKLFQLKVTVQHLQDTGVGRTVNALRKEPGEVGQAARSLVLKWKTMVAAEESDQEGDPRSDTSTHNGHSGGRYADDTQQSKNSVNSSQSSTPISNHKEQHSNINGHHSGTKRKYHTSEDEDYDEKKKVRHTNSREDTEKVVIKKEKVSDSEMSEDSENSDSDDSDSYTSSDSSREVKQEIKQEVKKEIKESSDSHKSSKNADNNHVDHKRESSSSSKRNDDRNSHKSSSKHTESSKSSSHRHKSSHEKDNSSDRRQKSDTSSDEKKESKSSKHSSEKHSSKPSSSENKNSSDGIKSSSHHSSQHKSSSHSDKSEKHKSLSDKDSKHKSKESSSSKEKHCSSKEKSDRSSSSKDRSSSSKDRNSSSKDRISSSKDRSRQSEKKHSHVKTHSSDDKSQKHDKHRSSDSKSQNSKKSKHRSEDASGDKKSKEKHSSSSHSKSSSSSSKSKEEEPKKKSKVSNSEESGEDGIDCGSGASFAEALGMISPAKPKKKSGQIKDINSPNSFAGDLSPASLLAPSAKLAPLPALEISALPEISPNYRPRPPPKLLPHFTEEEAISAGISSKNQRTKVYSGNKIVGKVTSLYEMCVHVLQEHIDALEYTGGVPYEILKPVVDRATPQQLFLLEHYNPYLMDDTDHLWQKFCEKSFRNKKRQELETWREMFLRCQEEQEHKLKSLTANIKLTQEAKKAPIKQTKMAYVDTVVKPPRNIARKQAVHGTAHAAAGSPAGRVAALAGAAGVLRGGARPAPAAPVSAAAFNKPKKAPLMQKALQFMRGRKR